MKVNETTNLTAIRNVPAFRGEIQQIPPMYSALKRNGQKLYDLARQGIEIEREARPVTIHRLELSAFRATESFTEADLTVTCSKGTYIRTLCHDIGEALECYGTMAALRRTKAGMFTLKSAVTPDQLRQMSEAERDALLLPIEDAFADLPTVKLPPFFAKLAHSGLEIYQKKIGSHLPEGTMVRFYDEDGFFALGEVRTYEDGFAIKPIKQF